MVKARTLLIIYKMKINIVGCGLSGITAARLLTDSGHNVVIYENRNHIGGNCYDSNVCGTTVHNYGPHIFHTDDEEVFNFLSGFTEWLPFELKPVGNTNIGTIPLPYSKKTISCIGRELSQDEIVEYIFKDYSEKQWGVDFNKIPKTITNRIPKTKNCDDPTWFEGQKYQCIPKEGYTRMFEKMLNGIEVRLNCEKDVWRSDDADFIIYTGKIDEFYQYRFGELPYRSLKFEHEVVSKKQETFIINECNKNTKYTRKYDHSYFDTNHTGITVITKEYPKQASKNDIPFYPIPWGEGQMMYNKYEELASKETNIIFAGRLATYKYLDMWMAIKQVMLKLKNIKPMI
jgi:UDP-galactopyranose mutase